MAIGIVGCAAVGAWVGYDAGTQKPNTSHIDHEITTLNAQISRARGANTALGNNGEDYAPARAAIQRAIAKQQGEIHHLRDERQTLLASAPHPHHQWEHAGYGAGIGIGIASTLVLGFAALNRVAARRHKQA
jgi:hypothetical protein